MKVDIARVGESGDGEEVARVARSLQINPGPEACLCTQLKCSFTLFSRARTHEMQVPKYYFVCMLVLRTRAKRNGTRT